MDIRQLTETYAVSPQIAPADAGTLKAAGFVRVICNRPDEEVEPARQAAAVRAAVEAAGMVFIDNPVRPGQFTPELVATQSAAIAAPGATFAYCASGNRSTIVWAMTQSGKTAPDTLIAAAARAGYNLEPVRALLG